MAASIIRQEPSQISTQVRGKRQEAEEEEGEAAAFVTIPRPRAVVAPAAAQPHTGISHCLIPEGQGQEGLLSRAGASPGQRVRQGS